MTNSGREKFRALLSQSRCVVLASVYDPISVRIAEGLGFEFGLVGGSMVSLSVLGAPDIALVTLTELTEQVSRVTRASTLPVIVDGDHGYGNALSVMRTVRELEKAGASAASIEDTALPQPFGSQGECQISIEEGAGKIKAAIEARTDPQFSILARTHALRITGFNDALRRCLAYTEAGADALFLLGASNLEDLTRIHRETGLPLILAQYESTLDASPGDFAGCGVRAILKGHHAFWSAALAIENSLRSLKEGRDPSTQPGDSPSDASRETWTQATLYKDAALKFLR
jgi:carboxyvinyl-carboxyphosphonate phosphorylmutase